MTYARLDTTALIGLTAHHVRVEVDIRQGLPAVTVVGLGDAAVMQARDRIRAAFGNSGFSWPDRRVTISLSPSDLPKQGSSYDLPIAVAMLAAHGAVPTSALEDVWAAGELGLAGDVRGVRGIVSSTLAARAGGARKLLVPSANVAEAALVPGIEVGGASSLKQVGEWLCGRGELDPPVAADPAPPPRTDDLADVRGQVMARRALEIAAAGGHNLLLVGPPGAGKTMLARRLPGILPELAREEALEVTQILSAAGFRTHGLVRVRPYRAPHHSISMAGLIGGGSRVPRPGEVSLAHHGVLFMDELAEFPRQALESLRQPLEDGYVTVVRSRASVRLPSQFTLVGATNPCPCGYAGDVVRRCRCGPEELRRYERKLSGPLLDRIDLCVQVERVRPEELGSLRPGERSADVRARVTAARARQVDRGNGVNARLDAGNLAARSDPTPDARVTLTAAANRLGLTARAYHRTLRVARTIADLSDTPQVTTDHVVEALSYRQFPSFDTPEDDDTPHADQNGGATEEATEELTAEAEPREGTRAPKGRKG